MTTGIEDWVGSGGHTRATPADLPLTSPEGTVIAVRTPPSLWQYTSTGWQLVAAPSGSQVPPVPASETTAGVVELATAAETTTGTDATRAVHPAGLKSALTLPSATSPTLVNSWANYGAPFLNAGYHKDSLGFVHLQGTVKNGTAATTIFTLPVGYRPAADIGFAVDNAGTEPGRVWVEASGAVVHVFGGNTRISLNGVYFRAA